MCSRFSTLATVGILLVAGASLKAQSLQTGAIMGMIRDKSGKPIPGAQLRARSGQTERIAVSDKKGTYRLPLLNVGDWSLTVTRDGFQTGTASVHVGINDTQTANFTMAVPSTVVVEVVGQTGNVDVTATQVSVNMDAEKLAEIPMNMTSLNVLDSLMATLPGVQVGSSGGFNILGAVADQNSFTVDGTVTNQTYNNQSGSGSSVPSTQPAREFIESVEVVTNALGAEYGVFGGVVNALTKSGTNTFQGNVFYATNFPYSQAKSYYRADWVPADSKPGEASKYHRYGFTASGPILKDKLFYFVGFQGFKEVAPPSSLNVGGTNWDGLKSDTTHTKGPNQWTAKLNWFINGENQLILSGTRSEYTSDSGAQYPDYGTLNSGTLSRSVSQSVNLTWNWVPTPGLFLVASVGNFKNPSSYGSMTGVSDVSTYYDYRYFLTGPGSTGANIPAGPEYAGYATGTGGLMRNSSNNPNTQYRVDVSWDLGRHQIKAGYLRQDTFYEEATGELASWSITNEIITPGTSDYLYGIRFTPSYTKYTGVLQSYYLKDVVELLPGLRLDAGIRYDPFSYKGAFGPYQGMHLADYHSFSKQMQPRIGLVWDVDRDGRKKIFAHFGRFFMAMPMTAISWAKTSGIYYDIWFPGSWSYNPSYSGGTPINFASTTPDLTMMLSGGEGKPQPHATELRLPRKNSITLGADWALGTDWSVGGTWTFWELKDVLDDSFFLNDDGSAAFSNLKGTKVIWNPGPGLVEFVDSDGVKHTWQSNFPEPKDRYIGVNLHASHHGARHDVSVNYTWTHHYGNYMGETANYLTYAQYGAQLGGGSGGATYDYDYARGITSGNYEANPVHEVKARGAFRFQTLRQEFQVGLTATWQSGLGMTKTMLAGGKWMTSASDTTFGGLNSTPISTDNLRGNMGLTPSLLQVNADLSAALKFGRLAIRPNLSINNLLNSRTALGYYTQESSSRYISNLTTDPNFGKVYSKQRGRSITAGIQLQF